MEKDHSNITHPSDISSGTPIRQDSRLSPQRLARMNSRILESSMNIALSKWFHWLGLMQYSATFIGPYWRAAKYFAEMEGKSMNGLPSWNAASDFVELLMFDMRLATEGTMSGLRAMSNYHSREWTRTLEAITNFLRDGKVEGLVGYSERQLELMDTMVNTYPRAIRDVEPEFGLHLENGGYLKVAETNRFMLYQVLPSDGNTRVRPNGKPVLIIPPYVLGANILSFLPGQNKSYVHAFANHGIPTYIRIVKDIATTPAVQVMTGEDDARDTRHFAELIMGIHGRKITLNGYCQGGFMSLIDYLSGELDDSVDALITSAAPIDGSRSKSLVEYIDHLPHRFRDLGYALKTLPNGNRVVDGKVISWVFKLKSMERESPLASFYRDLMMFDSNGGEKVAKVGKTAAAISHWLACDRGDLPVEITRLSFDSYTKPISEDGTLPVRLFGRPLNFRHIKERGLKWLICIAEEDDLTDRGATLAPLRYVDAEVTVFPKGHASMATSWSNPATPYSLDARFERKSPGFEGTFRGPVRFQLDLDEEIDLDQAA